MNAAVVKQRRPGNHSMRRRRAHGTFRERLIANFLNRLEAVTFSALVLVQGHKRETAGIIPKKKLEHQVMPCQANLFLV